MIHPGVPESQKSEHDMNNFAIALCFSLLAATATLAGEHSQWEPKEWKDGSTLKFQTVDANHEEHWSTVWYVVVDNDVYARLGAAATDRIQENINSPYVKVRIGRFAFNDVRADPADDMAVTIADELADKYVLDVLFRYIPHPLTVRFRAASFDF